MIDPSLKSTFNRILDGCAELEVLRFDPSSRSAKLTIALYPEERGLKRDPDWRRFVLQDVSAIRCWTGDEDLPPELDAIAAPTPTFMAFVASLYRNQWVLDWEVMGTAPTTEPRWQWSSGEQSQDGELILLCLDRPGSETPWTLGLWYGQLKVETPLESVQSLADFVAGWKFLAEAN